MDIFFNGQDLDIGILITGNVSYSLLLLSWFYDKTYIIRSISIAGWIMIICYLLMKDSISFIPILWNLLFISINGYKLVLYVLNNRKNILSTWQKKVFQMAFNTFEIGEFKEILSIGRIENYVRQNITEENKFLIKEQQFPDYIYLLTQGSIQIQSSKGLDIVVQAGVFLGEMSFIDNTIPGASVILHDNCEVIKWNQSDLKLFFKSHKIIKHKFYALFLTDILKKLRNTTAQLNTLKQS